MRYTAIFAPLIVVATGAFAQDDDPMAVQRCVWACLSNFGPADNPRYHQCVAEHCSEEAFTPAPVAGRWAASRLDPVDPPYLSGGAAEVRAPDGDYRLVYLCTQEGETLMLDGAGLPNGPGTVAVAWSIDRTLSGFFDFVPYEGALQIDITGFEEFVAGLRKGNAVSFRMNGAQSPFARFGLGGSSKAIASARADCG